MSDKIDITITLNSGRVIKAHDIEASYYITDEHLTAEDFSGRELLGAKIEANCEINGQSYYNKQVLEHGRLASIIDTEDGGSKVAFYEPDMKTREYEELKARVEYVAMMADVDKESE